MTKERAVAELTRRGLDIIKITDFHVTYSVPVENSAPEEHAWMYNPPRDFAFVNEK